VVSARPEDVAALHDLAGPLPLAEIGAVGGDRIAVAGADVALAEATALYEGAVPAAMGEQA
jgi:hypothetical protein